MSNAESPKDPFIEAQIEESLKPYLGITPPAVLAAMRASLEAALTTHPVAVGLINQLRERAAPHVSGDAVAGDGVDASPSTKAANEDGK